VNNAAYDSGAANANGNQTAIGGYAYTYDAENRMVSAVLNAGATLVSSAGYVYDGAGQRVQKMTCWSSVPCTLSSSDATITTYVYDAFGNLAQEYGPYLNAWCATPTCYLTQDQIGSTRMVTDANGLVGTRYDFLPFGEEVPAGTGGRTLSMGYNGWEDNSNPKFAGQMRDPESARDLMGFRYYSPQEGRFVSVDPGNAGADSGDPQTWNGYSYVGNNPVNYTDPDGLGFWSILGDIFDQFFTLGFGVGIGDSAPWNEQIPISGSLSGDPLNLGGVFGGGDAGGGIFSLQAATGGVAGPGIPSVLNDPIHFALNMLRLNIANQAAKKEGSLRYLVAIRNGKYGPGTNKCNEFVADTAELAGAPRPQVPYSGFRGNFPSVFGTRDPDANELANPNVTIPGWSSPMPVSSAQPGDIIAQQHGNYGHSGIVVSLTPGRQTASVNTANPANPGIITVNDWGFRPSGNGGGPNDPAPVVRRCMTGAR
jgi:RHS repeat-associated protein